jgi:hypothetical protein
LLVSSPGPPSDLFDSLLGEWAGEGKGLWSDDFSFSDQVSFLRRGRPWLEYRQVTVTSNGEVSHSESGYLFSEQDGSVTMTVAEPSGISEVLTGTCGTAELHLQSTSIGRSPHSRPVTATARRFSLARGKLVIEVAVAMNGEELTWHTRSLLEKI